MRTSCGIQASRFLCADRSRYLSLYLSWHDVERANFVFKIKTKQAHTHTHSKFPSIYRLFMYLLSRSRNHWHHQPSRARTHTRIPTLDHSGPTLWTHSGPTLDPLWTHSGPTLDLCRGYRGLGGCVCRSRGRPNRLRRSIQGPFIRRTIGGSLKVHREDIGGAIGWAIAAILLPLQFSSPATLTLCNAHPLQCS